jgi:hypothetical protein
MDMYVDLCRERVSDQLAHGYFQRLQETSATIRSHIEFMQYYEETGGKSPGWYNLRATVLDAASPIPSGRSAWTWMGGKWRSVPIP